MTNSANPAQFRLTRSARAEIRKERFCRARHITVREMRTERFLLRMNLIKNRHLAFG